MKLSQYVWLTVRESRGSQRRLLLFVACLAIGVAAIVAVAGLSSGLDRGIRAEARRLLAADVAVSARRPMPETLNELLERVELVALTKIDLVPDREAVADIEAKLRDRGCEVLRISSATREGIDALVARKCDGAVCGLF